MDILVPENDAQSPQAPRADEARVWGLVAAAIVLGLVLLVGMVDRNDRVRVASGEPAIVQKAPAPLVPETLLP